MSNQAVNFVLEQLPDLALRPSLRLAFLLLAERHNKDAHMAWPSLRTMAAETGVTVRRMREILGELEVLDLIRRLPRTSDSGRTISNGYQFMVLDVPLGGGTLAAGEEEPGILLGGTLAAGEEELSLQGRRNPGSSPEPLGEPLREPLREPGRARRAPPPVDDAYIAELHAEYDPQGGSRLVARSIDNFLNYRGRYKDPRRRLRTWIESDIDRAGGRRSSGGAQLPMREPETYLPQGEWMNTGDDTPPETLPGESEEDAYRRIARENWRAAGRI